MLKPVCSEALKRIFRLCDIDKNGLLHNDEINDFQVLSCLVTDSKIECFGAPLQRSELENIKKNVLETDQTGVIDNGLTESGFLCLQVLFIQKGRMETTWTILRTFGYDDDLTLRDDFLYPTYTHIHMHQLEILCAQRLLSRIK